MKLTQTKKNIRASSATSSQAFTSVTVLSCPVRCCSGWESNQMKFLIQPLPFRSPSRSVVVSVRICNFLLVRVGRGSCLHPLVYSRAELGVLSVVRRPTTHAARIQMRSVGQAATEVPVCKSGPISLRSLDRLTLREKRKCAAAHLRSRIKPALQASATAAALKAPDACRHQVRLPLRTLRVLREGKPQLGNRSSGVLG